MGENNAMHMLLWELIQVSEMCKTTLTSGTTQVRKLISDSQFHYEITLYCTFCFQFSKYLSFWPH